MPATMVQYLGTGRRKRSVARVFLRPGAGEIQVNGRAFDSYFQTESLRAPVRQPLLATGSDPLQQGSTADVRVGAIGKAPTRLRASPSGTLSRDAGERL